MKVQGWSDLVWPKRVEDHTPALRVLSRYLHIEDPVEERKRRIVPVDIRLDEHCLTEGLSIDRIEGVLRFTGCSRKR
jgi:hypothetical protein